MPRSAKVLRIRIQYVSRACKVASRFGRLIRTARGARPAAFSCESLHLQRAHNASHRSSPRRRRCWPLWTLDTYSAIVSNSVLADTQGLARLRTQASLDTFVEFRVSILYCNQQLRDVALGRQNGQLC
eukprot:4475861-Pleurochrysis_carterae.AAC.1